MTTKQERLEVLRKVVGVRAYASLRRGGTLRIWRCTTPYNWWVANRKGEMVWHSGECRANPSLDMFTSGQHSKRLIASHFLHRDGGKPESSEYKLQAKYRIK